VKQILSAGFLLQSARFEDFWKVDLAFATKVPGFTEAVRAFILEAISKSHSVVSTAVLKTVLNVSDKDVQDIVAAEQWTLEKDLVTVTPNEDNQMRPKKVQETIELDDVLKVVHTLSR
jgi:translation initiation factor 3 subunit K